MPTTHTVKQGEHISQLAERYGFQNYLTVWDHGNNSSLKKQRNPNVLFPGDEVFIPDKKEKSVAIPTTRTHYFRVAVKPLRLQIVVKDIDGKPMANTDCELDIDGARSPMKTDENGLVQKDISKTAVRGSLEFGSPQVVFAFRIGYLDPEMEESGWAARLANLGYHQGTVSGDEGRLRCAIEEFQFENGIPVTGELDDVTKAKLREAHGS